MRILGPRRRTGRLSALAAVLAIGLLVMACTATEDVDNATGDAGGPNLFGFVDGQLGFPHEVVTTQGNEAAGLYLPIFIVAVVIFVLVEGLLIVASLRFRRRGTAGDLPAQTHGNNRLEVIWTAVPALVVLVLFIGSTIVLTRVEAKSDDPAVVVDVQAFRFGWKFDYPDSGISIAGGGREGAPEMVLPVDEPVRFRLTSADVIHSFYVPSFFFKRDVVPGTTNEFEVTIEEPGTYGGQCAEFCGLAHGDMFFSVRAVERPDYDAWVAEQQSGAPPAEPAPAEPAPAGSGSPAVEAPSEVSKVLEIATTAEQSIAFTKTALGAQAGETITVIYTNDSKVPHNIAFYDGSDASGEQLAMSETITGPGARTEVTFVVPATPGDYLFRCEIHPMQMTGTLTVVP